MEDAISGGRGDDTIKGGAGHDTIGGGAGDDLIIGGPHHDMLDVARGGSGSDDRARVDVVDVVTGVETWLR